MQRQQRANRATLAGTRGTGVTPSNKLVKPILKNLPACVGDAPRLVLQPVDRYCRPSMSASSPAPRFPHVLVIGASGLVGGAFHERLARAGVRVTGTSHSH